MTLIKTYVTVRPVNAVAMSPLLDHVCINGILITKLMLLVCSLSFASYVAISLQAKRNLCNFLNHYAHPSFFPLARKRLYI